MIDTILPKWTIEIHKVFNYSWRWDFLCPEKVNIHLNRKDCTGIYIWQKIKKKIREAKSFMYFYCLLDRECIKTTETWLLICYLIFAHKYNSR